MMVYRHSVFFETAEVAESAQAWIRKLVVPDDIYQSRDNESPLIEVRFFTRHKLDRHEQRDVVRRASTYTLNCEDD